MRPMMEFQRISLDEFLLRTSDEPGLSLKAIVAKAENNTDFVCSVLAFRNELNSYFFLNQLAVAEGARIGEESDDVFESIILTRRFSDYDDIIDSEKPFVASWIGGSAIISANKSVDITGLNGGIRFLPKSVTTYRVKYRSKIYEYVSEMDFAVPGGRWNISPSSIAPELYSFKKVAGR
jgi:hypothetical protein